MKKFNNLYELTKYLNDNGLMFVTHNVEVFNMEYDLVEYEGDYYFIEDDQLFIYSWDEECDCVLGEIV